MELPVAEVLARHRASHRAFHHLFAGGSPGASIVQRDGGILALRCPARPERSLVNAVVYDDPDALAAALPALAAHYDEADIQAWTVWVHVGDAAAAEACRAAGHALDGTPELMWAPMGAIDLDVPPPTGVQLVDAPSWRTIGEVNDAAYGLPPEHLGITLLETDPRACHRTAAVVDGRAVACAAVNPVGEDAHVLLVATLPEHRGRGLAAACIRAGLRRAAADGATTTTLEATKLGRPVYERMGYRGLGSLQMWERRRA